MRYCIRHRRIACPWLVEIRREALGYALFNQVRRARAEDHGGRRATRAWNVTAEGAPVRLALRFETTSFPGASREG